MIYRFFWQQWTNGIRTYVAINEFHAKNNFISNIYRNIYFNAIDISELETFKLFISDLMAFMNLNICFIYNVY